MNECDYDKPLFVDKNMCPKCGYEPLFGTKTCIDYGFLKLKTKYLIHKECLNCGYEWEYEEY